MNKHFVCQKFTPVPCCLILVNLCFMHSGMVVLCLFVEVVSMCLLESLLSTACKLQEISPLHSHAETLDQAVCSFDRCAHAPGAGVFFNAFAASVLGALGSRADADWPNHGVLGHWRSLFRPLVAWALDFWGRRR